MGGHKVAEAEYLLDCCLEAEKAASVGVGFVPHHDRTPLAVGHGPGAAIGEQVNENVLGTHLEDVVFGGPDDLPSFITGRAPDWFDNLDPKGLGRVRGHWSFLSKVSSGQ